MTNLLLTLAALLLGTLLWRLGKRGWRVDFHPVCRHCRYDLFNLPETSARCPECGTELSTKNATRIGNRRSDGPLTWTGILLALISLPFIALTATKWWQNFDGTPFLPFAILEDRFKHNEPRATQLLEARLKTGQLSSAQATRLVRDLTTWQDDPSVTGIVGSPFDFVVIHEKELLRAGVDPAVIDAYFAHACRIDATWRPVIARNEPCTIRISFRIVPVLRFAIRSTSHAIAVPQASLCIENTTFPLTAVLQPRLTEDVDDRDALALTTSDPRFWQMEKNGRIEGSLVIETDFDINTYSPLHVRQEKNFSVQVVSAGTPTVKTVTDPALEPLMAKSFHVDALSLTDKGEIQEPYYLFDNFKLMVDPLPENVAMSVYFEQSGNRWNQGTLIRSAGVTSLDLQFVPRIAPRFRAMDTQSLFVSTPGWFWSRSGMVPLLEFIPTEVNPHLPLYLVFDSNSALAATHTAFDRIWQGQIRLPVKINIVNP